MASNPMQRKVRNSFLLGMIITLIIAAGVIFLLYTKFKQVEKEAQEEVVQMKSVYVVNNQIASGGRLNSNIALRTAPADLVPANAATMNDLMQYVMEDEAASGDIVTLLPDQIVSKIALEPGTILTTDMIGNVDGTYMYEKQEDGSVKIDVNSGMRLEEYNMIALPSKLEIGDYIDIRLQLPTGATFIVASKKYVEDTNATTVWIKVSEEEILAINNAIVEAYTMKGSKLYADIYVEGGYQNKADITYVPSSEVYDLIKADNNVIEKARNYLNERYTDSMKSLRNDVINYNLNLYNEDRLDNTEEGITQEIESLREARENYLGELGAYSTTGAQ